MTLYFSIGGNVACTLYITNSEYIANHTKLNNISFYNTQPFIN